MMFAAGPEQNGNEEGHDCPEADPPRKFHHGQPAGLDVNFAAENSRDVVGQAAQNRDDDEAHDHRHDVAEIVAARFG